jgi:hypothetical protein
MNDLAVCYADLGQHAEALKLHEQTLALRKAKLGPDHPYTIGSLLGVAHHLSELDRGAEAVPYIDECLMRGTLNQMKNAVYLRVRHFENSKDAAECRATAEMWEKVMGTDSGLLPLPSKMYVAAQIRAVTARVFRTNENAHAADDESDRAMAWLTQAVAAGFEDVAQIKKDKYLDALRDREDLKMLIRELEDRKN